MLAAYQAIDGATSPGRPKPDARQQRPRGDQNDTARTVGQAREERLKQRNGGPVQTEEQPDLARPDPVRAHVERQGGEDLPVHEHHERRDQREREEGPVAIRRGESAERTRLAVGGSGAPLREERDDRCPQDQRGSGVDEEQRRIVLGCQQPAQCRRHREPDVRAPVAKRIGARPVLARNDVGDDRAADGAVHAAEQSDRERARGHCPRAAAQPERDHGERGEARGDRESPGASQAISQRTTHRSGREGAQPDQPQNPTRAGNIETALLDEVNRQKRLYDGAQAIGDGANPERPVHGGQAVGAPRLEIRPGSGHGLAGRTPRESGIAQQGSGGSMQGSGGSTQGSGGSMQGSGGVQMGSGGKEHGSGGACRFVRLVDSMGPNLRLLVLAQAYRSVNSLPWAPIIIPHAAPRWGRASPHATRGEKEAEASIGEQRGRSGGRSGEESRPKCTLTADVFVRGMEATILNTCKAHQRVRRVCGKSEAFEHEANRRCVGHLTEHFQPAAALRAGEDVHLEGPTKQSRPVHARSGRVECAAE
jgi:hypothetical protein